MELVYALQNPPDTYAKSIFLMGPTPRAESGGESWRPKMVQALKDVGYDGVVFLPETENGEWKHNYTEQIEWEQKYLDRCDCILAWVPRDLKTMPAFTTNVEFGAYVNSGRMVYGRPDGAPKMRYLDALYLENTKSNPARYLFETAQEAVESIGEGAVRTGGQLAVPLDIWKSPQFQSWYTELVQAGNRLDDAKVLWTFRVGPKKNFLFSYTLQVKVWVASEKRYKENEYVFSRTDISTIVAYSDDLEILLVKEYRAPARTSDGFVHELPGGSSFKANQDPAQVAAEELKEEAGLEVAPERFSRVHTRQIGATLSSHRAHVFKVLLTAEEIENVKQMERDKVTHGVAEDSEITYVEVRTLEEIVKESLVDWSTLGMILEVFVKELGN